MSIALELRGVTKRFVAGAGICTASVEALRCIDLDVDAGDAVAVVGGPGTGKSTLLLCAAGLLVPDTGIVRWFGDASRGVAATRSAYSFAPARHVPRREANAAPRVHLLDGLDALDLCAVVRLADWIERRVDTGDAILVATRDVALAHRLARRVVTMRAGRTYPTVEPVRAARVAERATGLVSEGGTM